MLSFLFYIFVLAWSSIIYVVTFIALILCYPFDKKRFVVHKLSKWITDSFFGFGLVMKRKRSSPRRNRNFFIPAEGRESQ